jgi:protein-tyrosine phosphatase
MIDLHTHVMYGWDDGAETIDDSMAMVRMAAADGTRVIAATPHMLWSNVRVDIGVIEERVKDINERVAAEGLDIRVVTGCEVPATWDSFNLIKHKQVATLAGSRSLLFEVPFKLLPVQFPDLLFQVRMTGITPLMAHPERSEPFITDHALFRSMIEPDIAVQITSSSLTGSYGDRIQAFAWEIVGEERPIVVASDAHGVDRRRPCLAAAHAALSEKLGKEAADLMCRDNPAAVLEDKVLRIANIKRAEPVAHKRGLASRLRSVFGGS